MINMTVGVKSRKKCPPAKRNVYHTRLGPKKRAICSKGFPLQAKQRYEYHVEK